MIQGGRRKPTFCGVDEVNGFLIPADLESWHVRSGLSKRCARRLNVHAQNHSFDLNIDPAGLSTPAAVTTLVRELIDSYGNGATASFCAQAIRICIEDQALLHPVNSSISSFPQYGEELVDFIEKSISALVFQVYGSKRSAFRSTLAKYYLCTNSDTSRPVTAEELARYLAAFTDASRKNSRWRSDLGKGTKDNFAQVAASLPNQSILRDALQSFRTGAVSLYGRTYVPNPTQQWQMQWIHWYEDFLDTKMYGSVGRAEVALGHFLRYLDKHEDLRDPENFFRWRVGKPSIAGWLARHYAQSTVASTLTYLRSFFESVLNNRDEFSSWDPVQQIRLVREEFHVPIKPSELTGTGVSRRSETVQMALPQELMKEVEDVLLGNDMEWAKQRSIDWMEAVNPETGDLCKVFCPVMPYLLAFLIRLPVRSVQAKRLASGEGDELVFDLKEKVWQSNTGQHAGYWKKLGVKNPRRGALRPIVDSWTGETFCGFWINSNKMTDRRTLFDETSGYEISWQNEEVIDIVLKMRQWQERWNPLPKPVKYTQVRSGVFEKMHPSSLSDLRAASRPVRLHAPFAERPSRCRTIRPGSSHFRTIRPISSVAMTFSEATGRLSDVASDGR